MKSRKNRRNVWDCHPLNLRRFVIETRTPLERDIAIRFYRNATHARFKDWGGDYVGMINPISGTDFKDFPRKVVTGYTTCECETIVPFAEISKLADTPSRVEALHKAKYG